MSTTRGRKLDIPVTLRFDPRDWARLLIYFKQRGTLFEDRAARLRTVCQEFLRLVHSPEITTLEAEEALAEEAYVKTPRQKIVREISQSLDNARFDQARRLASLSEIDVEKAIEDLPLEEEENKGEQTE